MEKTKFLALAGFELHVFHPVASLHSGLSLVLGTNKNINLDGIISQYFVTFTVSTARTLSIKKLNEPLANFEKIFR